MSAPPRPAPVACSAEELSAIGLAHGLDAIGFAPADPLERARRMLEERRAGGLHGGMAFTYKNPQRSTTPTDAVAGARTIIVGARGYLLEEPPPPSAASGRIARYAWVEHYAPLREALWEVAHELRRRGWKAVAYADDNSVVDREVAWLAGIGWYGKNANLLLARAGSRFVLGSVITDAPIERAPRATRAVADGCGTCRLCVDACPTGAIVAPGVIDGNRCLSWLLQKPGIFPAEHRIALGNRLYGCDECQEVCPPNIRFGRPRPAPTGATAWVGLVDLLGASDEEILARHGRWYIHHREARWVRRNALIVLGNVGDGTDAAVGGTLVRYLADADPVLRAHAVWAAHRLGRDDLLPASDPDPDVAAELVAAQGGTERGGR